MCVSWDGTTGQGKFYGDGTLIHTRNDCAQTTVGGGGYRQYIALGYSDRGHKDYIKYAERILITGYVLWDNILTDEEILESSKVCQETRWSPVVIWKDFHQSVQKNAADYLITPSQCRATV